MSFEFRIENEKKKGLSLIWKPSIHCSVKETPMNKHKMKTTLLLLIVVLVMMGISWVLVDAKGFDQESSPQHQKIKTVLLAWIDAIEKGDIPIAASLCVVEPTREHDLFITLADASANMRLRTAALQKYGPQGSSGGWLYQGDTAQEIREIFANIEIVIDGDIATLKEQKGDKKICN